MQSYFRANSLRIDQSSPTDSRIVLTSYSNCVLVGDFPLVDCRRHAIQLNEIETSFLIATSNVYESGYRRKHGISNDGVLLELSLPRPEKHCWRTDGDRHVF